MMPTQAGRYRGEVLEVGVRRTGQNNLLTVTLRFELTEIQDAGAWASCADEGLEITSYNYLEKKDGSLNERTIRTLQEVFGWPGGDPFWFEDNELTGAQVTLEFEEWQGQERLKVKWLNPFDSEGPGGVAKSDAEERRAVMAQIGAKLRAFGAPPAAAKPAGPPPRTPVPDPEALTEETVWARWSSSCKTAEMKDAERNDLWNAAIHSVERGEVGKNLSSDEWRQVEIALEETMARREAEEGAGDDGE